MLRLRNLGAFISNTFLSPNKVNSVFAIESSDKTGNEAWVNIYIPLSPIKEPANES